MSRLSLDVPHAWVASIEDAGGRLRGMGLCVEARWIFTCTHVVARALGLADDDPVPVGQPVTVRFPFHRELAAPSATVVCAHPPDPILLDRFEDICLLRLEEEAPGSAGHEQLRQVGPRRRSPVKMFGYPDQSRPGVWALEDTLSERVELDRWQIQLAPNSPLGPGYSGTVVWDQEEDGPVGLLFADRIDQGVGYLIPFESLLEACPQPLGSGWLPGGVRETHPESAPARGWFEQPVQRVPDRPQHGPALCDVFLSYHGNDRALAQQLKGALATQGLRAWLDVDELTPGRPWQEELELAIARSPAAAVLIGPSGLGPWEQREMRAFLNRFVERAVPVIPVLLPGLDAEPELPLFLRDFTWVDLRGGLSSAGLGELVRGLTAAADRGQVVGGEASAHTDAPGIDFRLHGVPRLPRDYQPRPEFDALKGEILDNRPGPVAVAGVQAAFALHGMGGVGKTVLAIAVCRDPEVRQAFPDGVYWVTIGEQPDLLALQAQLARQLGVAEVDLTDVEEARALLAERCTGKALLLVLDDVWDPEHAEAFDVTGDLGRLLVTSRNREVASALRTAPTDVGDLSEESSLALLASASEVAELPAEAAALAHACAHHALALSLVGTALRGRPADRWAAMLDDLRQGLASLEARLPGYAYPSVKVAIEASLDGLDDAKREALLDFAILPEDVLVPEQVLLGWWGAEGISVSDAMRLIDTLVDRALVRRDGSGRLSLHDLVRDVLRAAVADQGEQALAQRHGRFVARFLHGQPRSWVDAMPEGYEQDHVVHHLLEAGRSEEARQLVQEPRWWAARVDSSGVSALLADLRRAAEGREEGLDLLARTLIQSRHVVSARPRELLCQLLHRLLSADSAVASALRERIAAERWQGLVPRSPSLADPMGSQQATLVGHTKAVTSVALSGDGRTAVSGSRDGTVRMWDLRAGTSEVLEGHMDWVTSVALSGDGRTAVSGSSDRTVRVWDLGAGTSEVLKDHTEVVTSVALSGDGRTAVSGSLDRTVRVWDLGAGTSEVLEGHMDWVTSVALSGDGRTVVSGSSDGTVRVWDLGAGTSEVLECHASWVASLALSADGRTAVSGSSDGTVRVWDLGAGTSEVLEGQASWVASVALSGDGRTAVSGSSDGTVRVWDLGAGMSEVLECHAGDVLSVALSGDGRTMVSGSDDLTLRVWDLGAGTSEVLEGHTSWVTSVALSGDGRTAVSGSFDSTLRVWDLRAGTSEVLEGHAGEEASVALSGDGRTAVSGHHDRTLRVWDLGAGTSEVLEGHSGDVLSVALSGDGRTVVSGSSDGTVRVWDLGAGTSEVLKGHPSWVTSLALSGDGRTAVSGHHDRTLCVWDLGAGTSEVLEGHTSRVSSVALSGDGRTAVSGSDDSTLRVWSLGSGTSRVLQGHAGDVSSVVLSSDGRMAVSGSSDSTLRVWDIADGCCLASATVDAPVLSVALSETGVVVAGDASGRVHHYLLRL